MAEGKPRDKERFWEDGDVSPDDDLLNEDSPPEGSSLVQVQREVDDVADLMRHNIGMVIERGDRLDDIEERSEYLMEGAAAFHTGARNVRRKMWWQNIRMTVLLGSIAVVIFIILLVYWLR